MTNLMNPQEVSEYIGIPTGTLDQWRYRRTGPPFMKVGRHVRYRRSGVDEWLDGMTHVAEEA